MFNANSNLFTKLFLLIFFLPLPVACQTGVTPKTSPDNQTVNNSNRNKSNESKSEKTETAGNAEKDFGNAVSKTDVARKGNRIEDFSPKNWYLMMKAEGDLNDDNLPDAAAVFSKAKLFDGVDESTRSTEQPEADVAAERVLIIALRDAEGALNLDELTQKIILCRTCGAQMDDTLLGFSIKNGAIEIAQGALGTSSFDYLHKIKKDERRGWIVFYGEGKYRERSTGKESTAKQKGIIDLNDFDISKETENLDGNARPQKK